MAHGHHDQHGQHGQHRQEELHNPDTSHETSDVNIRAIIWFVVVLTLAGVVIDATAYGVFMALDHYEATHQPDISPLALPSGTAPPEPRLQTTPWTDLKVLRQEESDYLHGYGWVDQSSGVARIPIDKAKALLLQRGIPARSGAGDPTEGTHAAFAFGQSNSARGIPAGEPDRSGSGGTTSPSGTESSNPPSATGATGATEPAAASARPETKTTNPTTKKPGGGK